MVSALRGRSATSRASPHAPRRLRARGRLRLRSRRGRGRGGRGHDGRARDGGGRVDGAHGVELQALLHGERAGEEAEEVNVLAALGAHVRVCGDETLDARGDLLEATGAARELERDVL